MSKVTQLDDIQRLELVVHDRHPYFGTKQPEGKITNIHKWDQAFRMYTTIYVQANPHCASEIIQYTHIIHTAAANYQWDSVAYYDFMFWHLMAAKPWRSWAKTYSQGWNLALKRDYNNHQGASVGRTSNQGSYRNFQNAGRKRREKAWKEDCCLKFNKNKCNRGADCRYNHRCTYCGAWNHSFLNCRKHKTRQETKSEGTTANVGHSKNIN